MQHLKCVQQQVDTVPWFKGAHEAQDKVTIELKEFSNPLAVNIRTKPRRIYGVWKNMDSLGRHAGFTHVLAQPFRNRNQESGPTPEAVLDSACQRRTG